MQRNLKVITSHQENSDLEELFSAIADAPTGIILPAQLRAARGLLNWSRSECAQAVGISPETIKNIEHGTYIPQQVTCDRILKSFAEYGVEFLNLINFQLNTVYGPQLGKHYNVAGAVLVLPRNSKNEVSR